MGWLSFSMANRVFSFVRPALAVFYLPPPQALNNKADMLFDADTVDIQISAGENKLLRCMMGSGTVNASRKTICIDCRIGHLKRRHFVRRICQSLPLFSPSHHPPSTLGYIHNCIQLL